MEAFHHIGTVWVIKNYFSPLKYLSSKTYKYSCFKWNEGMSSEKITLFVRSRGVLVSEVKH